MPHFPKPFFKKARGVWYVEIERKQVNLGPDRDEAFRRYYQLMTQPRPTKVAADSVLGVIDAFLEWCSKHRAPDTYRWYHDRLQEFVQTIDPALDCRAAPAVSYPAVDRCPRRLVGRLASERHPGREAGLPVGGGAGLYRPLARGVHEEAQGREAGGRRLPGGVR